MPTLTRIRGIKDINGNVTGLWVPGGDIFALTYTYTWAALPAAADYIGTAYVSDVGLHGSMWRSDGSTWGLIGGVCVLARSAVATSLTGTTALTTLVTQNMPGNLLGLNGAYRWRGKVSVTNNANAKTLYAYISGNLATGVGLSSLTTSGFEVWIENRNSASSQLCSNGSLAGISSAGAVWTTTATDTAIANTLTLQAQLGVGSDTLTIESWQLELHRP